MYLLDKFYVNINKLNFEALQKAKAMYVSLSMVLHTVFAFFPTNDHLKAVFLFL